MIIFALFCLLASPALACQSVNGLPDPDCTPGAIDPHVTQDNIHQTICVPGYSKTVRPPVSVSNAMKRRVMKEYGLPWSDHKQMEGDHFLPIEAGGCPGPDAGCDFHANFWPEPWNGKLGAHAKDKIENHCHRAICSGKITLRDAQAQLMKDWRTACQ